MNKDNPYYPHTLEQKLGYLVEECGEVLAAAGKGQRWGLESVNPELPPEEQETNREWLLRELVDLKQAISIVESAISKKRYHKDGSHCYDTGCGRAHGLTCSGCGLLLGVCACAGR